jgi:hypothetical protein
MDNNKVGFLLFFIVPAVTITVYCLITFYVINRLIAVKIMDTTRQKIPALIQYLDIALALFNLSSIPLNTTILPWLAIDWMDVAIILKASFISEINSLRLYARIMPPVNPKIAAISWNIFAQVIAFPHEILDCVVTT